MPKHQYSPHPTTPTKLQQHQQNAPPYPQEPPPVAYNERNNISTQTLKSMTYPTIKPKQAHVPKMGHSWHIRLDNAHPANLATIANRRLITTMPHKFPKDIKVTCSAFQQAHHVPSLDKPKQQMYPMRAYISSDSSGTGTSNATYWNNHMLLVICARSRFTIAYFVKDCRDIPAPFDATLHHIRGKMHRPLKEFTGDNAKKYMSYTMERIYDQWKLQIYMCTLHRPQGSSGAERMKKRIMNSVGALLATASLST